MYVCDAESLDPFWIYETRLDLGAACTTHTHTRMDKWADGWIDTALPKRIRKVGTNQVEASVSDPTAFAPMMLVITSLVKNM